MSGCDHLRAVDVVKAIDGLTYRRLHFWTTLGLVVEAHRHLDHRGGLGERIDGRGGSGVPFWYDRSAVPVLAVVTALTEPCVRRRDTWHGGPNMAVPMAFRLARDPDLVLPLSGGALLRYVETDLTSS